MADRTTYAVKYERHDRPGEVITWIRGTYVQELAASRFQALTERKTTKRAWIETRIVGPWTISAEWVSEPGEHDDCRVSSPPQSSDAAGSIDASEAT